ncbi:MAG: LacI family DNA-binding transcriptional regulator [Acidobacteria bacterium]|nr:LacI family DNA-binding transcriptional regulator [Acidobacteriota bacterium]
MAKMKDVAERAGVAESTVSHVINNTRFVTPATRERVLRVMSELNFHGNAHARRLARGHSDFLGLIISDIENPFFPGLIKSFESSALAGGFDILLCTTNYDAARAEAAFRKMIENKVPGVAVMTSRVDPSLASVLQRNDVASIFLDSGQVAERTSNIRIQYSQGAEQAVAYLHNLGHRDFAFIAGPGNRSSHAAYKSAVVGALEQLGLEARLIDGENSVASGERAVQKLLTSRKLPTAILASNDLTAIGALRAFHRAGIRVPADVSVVGADDIPFASLTNPSLTTVQIGNERLGELACQKLLGMLRDSDAASELVLPTELVIRESTALAAH